MDLRRLQKDIFASNERLVAVLQVSPYRSKAEKKPKSRLLCLTLKSGSVPSIHIVKVSDASLKRIHSWKLEELRLLEGPAPDAASDSGLFSLTFDSKPFVWQSASVAARDAFVDSIVRLSQSHLQVRPTLKNLRTRRAAGFSKFRTDATATAGTTATLPGADDDGGCDDATTNSNSASRGGDDAAAAADTETYRELTLQEEMDLTSLLRDAHGAIGNAELFASQLASDMHQLDAANTHELLESFQKTEELMCRLDIADSELERIDGWLERYESALGAVTDAVKHVTGHHGTMQLQRDNKRKLLNLLDHILETMSLPESVVNTLRTGPLERVNLPAVTAAAAHLRRAMECELDDALTDMVAVQDQRALFASVQDDFLNRLATFFTSRLFVRHVENTPLSPSLLGRHTTSPLVLSDSLTAVIRSAGTSDASFLSHQSRFSQLLPYTQLMQWVRDADCSHYDRLCSTYAQVMRGVYHTEIRELIDRLQNRRSQSTNSATGPSSSLSARINRARFTFRSTVNDDNLEDDDDDNITTGTDNDAAVIAALDAAARRAESEEQQQHHDSNPTASGPEQLFHMLLSSVVPLVVGEQNFCEEFFGLAVPNRSTHDDDDDDDGDNDDDDDDAAARTGNDGAGGSADHDGGNLADDSTVASTASSRPPSYLHRRQVSLASASSGGGIVRSNHHPLSSVGGSTSTVVTGTTSDADSTPSTPTGEWARRKKRQSVTQVASLDYSQRMASLRSVMNSMFSWLEDELVQIINATAGSSSTTATSTAAESVGDSDKSSGMTGGGGSGGGGSGSGGGGGDGDDHQLSALAMLVRIDEFTNLPEVKETFIYLLLGKCQILTKRIVDRFFDDQLRAVRDTRVPKKGRAVILPFVLQLPHFIGAVEETVRDSARWRTLVDGALGQLMQAVFETIERIASACKHPEVVCFVNYHHLCSLVPLRKVASLAPVRRDAQVKYRDNLQAYVRRSLGHPMEKLSRFFEAVQQLIDSGVIDNEVGFQVQFSKQELKRTIGLYPGAVVKKGLEAMYRTLKKQLTDSDSLLPVVWRSVQEDFLAAYHGYEDLIKRCWPGSEVRLEFSLADLLSYFSNV